MLVRKIIALIFLLNGVILFAQVRKYSNDFLSIGVGAHHLAKGGAVVSSTGDVNSVFWNPAGITNLETDMQVGAMHNDYFAGIASFNHGGMIRPLSGSGKYLGLSFVRLDIDMIPNTLRLVNPDGSINYDNIEDFSISDNAFILTYAQKSNIEGLSFGGNFKVIRRKYAHFAGSWGFGFDLGAQYAKDNLRLGANLKDATTTFNVWSFGFTQEERDVLESTGNIVPTGSTLELTAPNVHLGASYNITIANDFNLQPELNFRIDMDGKRNVLANLGPMSIDPTFGLELNYKNIVYLWSGLNNYQRFTNDNGEQEQAIEPNLGVGVKVKSFRVNYAMTNIGESSQGGSANQYMYSNVFSLIIDINKKSL